MGTNRLNVQPAKSRLRGLRSGLASLARRLRPPSPRGCCWRPYALPAAGGGGAPASLPPAPAAPPPPLRPLAAPRRPRVCARPPFRSLGWPPSRVRRATARYACSPGTGASVGKGFGPPSAPVRPKEGDCTWAFPPLRSGRIPNCRTAPHTHRPACAMCPAPPRIGPNPHRPSRPHRRSAGLCGPCRPARLRFVAPLAALRSDTHTRAAGGHSGPDTKVAHSRPLAPLRSQSLAPLRRGHSRARPLRVGCGPCRPRRSAARGRDALAAPPPDPHPGTPRAARRTHRQSDRRRRACGPSPRRSGPTHRPARPSR